MIKDDELIEVINRFNGSTGYKITDTNQRRHFEPREKKMIPMGELRKLTWEPGGTMLLQQYLVIKNEEAIRELLGDVEPEYFYTAEQVKELLVSGSLDALMDTLEFAPQGVIDMIKDISVDIRLNDMNKRQTIFNHTGFNVTKAIENVEAEIAAAADEGVEEQAKKQRRVALSNTNEGKSTTASSGRRLSEPAFTIKK